MALPVVGFVGWRGMVGSVLMERMLSEQDFDQIEPIFFSTSNSGGQVPLFGGKKVTKNEPLLQDANSIDALKKCDYIISTQGGDYTKAILSLLEKVVGLVIGLMLLAHFE